MNNVYHVYTNFKVKKRHNVGGSNCIKNLEKFNRHLSKKRIFSTLPSRVLLTKIKASLTTTPNLEDDQKKTTNIKSTLSTTVLRPQPRGGEGQKRMIRVRKRQKKRRRPQQDGILRGRPGDDNGLRGRPQHDDILLGRPEETVEDDPSAAASVYFPSV